MTIQKGWFIKSKEPNDIFWSLRPEVNGGWTTEIDKALLFARKSDAEDYFNNHFHPTAHSGYVIGGIN